MAEPEIQETPKQFPTVKEMSGWVYAYLQPLPRGTTIPYADLSLVLHGGNPQQPRYRAAVLRASRRLLALDNKHLRNLRGRGYEIVLPADHAEESKRYHRHSLARAVRGLGVAIHCALDEIADDLQRQRVIDEGVKRAIEVGVLRRVGRIRKLPPATKVALPSGSELLRIVTARPKASGE